MREDIRAALCKGGACARAGRINDGAGAKREWKQSVRAHSTGEVSPVASCGGESARRLYRHSETEGIPTRPWKGARRDYEQGA